MGLNIGLDAGGELGCCYATSRKTACFLAAGGGVSFGTPQGGASIGLSGSMTFTALRDIGDAQGHADSGKVVAATGLAPFNMVGKIAKLKAACASGKGAAVSPA